VIHSFADGRITDTGPLTKKRMETIDEEVTAKALDFMERAKKADKPFFLWWNSTRMHIFTHLKAESDGKTGLGIYADGMVEHDGHVGQVLAKLKELGLEENTIVMYSTDNGAESFTWPTAARRCSAARRTPVGGRLPRPDADPLARRHQARHGDQRHRRPRGHAADAARRGRRSDRKEDLLKGRKIGGRPTRSTSTATTSLPALKGEAEWPRKEFIYWTDDGSVAALRYGNWKATFLRQEAHGLHVWQEPFKVLRAPMLTNLRMDPFELAALSTPWTTSAGSSSTCSVAADREFPAAGAYVGGGCRASASSRRARSPAASTSIRGDGGGRRRGGPGGASSRRDGRETSPSRGPSPRCR
jgi:hypothetical protein